MKYKDKKTNEDMMKEIIKLLPIMEKRIFFDDQNLTIQEQMLINDLWINISKKETISYDKDYFYRKLIGK